MDRKFTAWKKNRKFGDVYGGRKSPKIANNIFNRVHSLERSIKNRDLPILIEENPSRDFFFPLTGDEVVEALKALPKRDYEGITHIWMRRVKKNDYISGKRPLAWFMAGSGVRAIVLFPFPKDMRQLFGKKRPSNRIINELEKYGAQIKKKGLNWYAVWSLENLRKYYIQGILYHEVGHHVDYYYRHWSGPNREKAEEYADQYSWAKTATATHIYNRLENGSKD